MRFEIVTETPDGLAYVQAARQSKRHAFKPVRWWDPSLGERLAHPPPGQRITFAREVPWTSEVAEQARAKVVESIVVLGPAQS